MSDSSLVIPAIIAVFAIAVLVSYAVGRTSRRAGIALATSGIFLGVVLIVNYVEQVPVAFEVAGLAAPMASMTSALFDVIRKDAVTAPS